IEALAFSADGKTLAIRSDRVEALAFSPDGKTLAVEKTVRVRIIRTDDPRQSARVRVWDLRTGQQVPAGQGPTRSEGDDPPAVLELRVDPPADQSQRTELLFVVGDADPEFLRRVMLSARGTPPTALEERYFVEDKDPNKREKLLNTLLQDPA